MYKLLDNNHNCNSNSIISSLMFALIILIVLKATTVNADVLVYARGSNQVSFSNNTVRKVTICLLILLVRLSNCNLLLFSFSFFDIQHPNQREGRQMENNSNLFTVFQFVLK